MMGPPTLSAPACLMACYKFEAQLAGLRLFASEHSLIAENLLSNFCKPS